MRLFLAFLSLEHKGDRVRGTGWWGALAGWWSTERANTNHHLIRCHRCCCHWLRRRPPKHSRGSTAGAPAREKKVTPACEQRGGSGASLVPAVQRAPRSWHLPWPDALVPRGPTAARDRRPGGRTRTGGRTPWSGADAVTAGGAHCPRGPRSPRCGARCESPLQLTWQRGSLGASSLLRPRGPEALRGTGSPRVGSAAPVAGKLCR